MSLHSKRSPSQAKKFLTCAGSLALSATVPEAMRRTGGDAARLGTAVHAMNEHCLKHGKQPDDLRDRIVYIIERGAGEEDGASILREGAKMPKAKADHHCIIVDDKMIEDSQICVDYVRQRCADLGVSEKALQLETRTNPLPERDDTSGSADTTIDAWPELLEVADYKNGYLQVDHEDNEQATAYLLGKAIETDFSHELYRTTIVQPNSPHPDGPIRFQEYTAEELKAFQKKYRAGIKRCESAEDEFEKAGLIDGEVNPVWADRWLKPGDHCTFCDAGATCPARAKMAEQLAQIEFADEPVEIQLPAVVKPGAVVESTEEQVARILSWEPFLQSLFKAAALYAHRALEAGYEIPGFKLVARRSNREFKPGTAKALVAEMVKAGYIKDADKAKLFVTKLISGPQAEKLVPAKKRKAFNERFLIKPDNGTAIAPADDPRPQVESSVADDFESFEENEFE